MITSRSILIRARGRTRVLRLRAIGRALMLLPYDVRHDQAMCLRCGCTDIFGCAGGCSWANAAHTICTRCVERSMLS